MADANTKVLSTSRSGTAKPGASAWLAGIAGWALPGAGHLIQRRPLRALVLSGSTFFLFALGLVLGGHLFSLAAPESPGASPLLRVAPVLANVGIGLPYIVCSFLDLGFTSKAALPTSEYGNTFLWVSGLLNYLVALDAFDIAVGRKP